MLKHPNYNGNADGYPNDIAVVGFSVVHTNANVQYIPLASSEDYDNKPCIITGWGTTQPGQ